MVTPSQREFSIIYKHFHLDVVDSLHLVGWAHVCCNKNIYLKRKVGYLYTLTLLCILYGGQDSSSSLSVAQVSWEFPTM